MRFYATLATLLTLHGVAAADDELTTGSTASLHSSRGAAHLGGDGPQFLLYLRTNGALGTAGKDALAAALLTLARVPGAGVDVYLNPGDRDAPALATALAALPDEMARESFLVALLQQDLPRWSDSQVMTRIGRSAGFIVQRGRVVLSPAGHAFLRAPPGLSFSAEAFFAQGRRVLHAADLDMAPDLESLAPPVAPAIPDAQLDRALAVGDALASHVVAIRFALPVVPRDYLLEALRLYDLGRIRLRFELVAQQNAGPKPGIDGPGTAVLRRAFVHADPKTRVALTRMLAKAIAPDSVAAAIWLIQSAGVDPEPLLAGPPDVQSEDHKVGVAVSVDGNVASGGGDLRPLANLPSLRQRLERP